MRVVTQNKAANGGKPLPIRTTIINPVVHLLSSDSACIAYIRITQCVDRCAPAGLSSFSLTTASSAYSILYTIQYCTVMYVYNVLYESKRSPHVHVLLLWRCDRNGVASTQQSEETRVWTRHPEGNWTLVHFHRSSGGNAVLSHV